MKTAAAWALLAIYVALAAGAVVLVAFDDGSADALGTLGFAGFAGVGTLIALRRPGNAVGWVLLAVSISFAIVETGEVYANHGSHPGRVAVAVAATLMGDVWPTLAVIFLPLLFPHGRLPSSRWRPVLWLGAADLVLGVAAVGLTPGELDPLRDTGIENPFGIEGGVPEILNTIDLVVGGVALILAAASVVVRFRHARGSERQQLKWFAYAGILAAACLSVAVLVGSAQAEQGRYTVLATVAWGSGLVLVGLGLPAATGIAIFRHRLYDVDVVIRRTLVYGALTVTLGATYLGLVLLIGLAVGRSGFAVAVSTLAVAALFRPALRRIQAVVDQRFYRRRYDAARTLEVFAGRLRDQIDLDALSDELRGVTQQTVQPAHVSLWLRSPR